MAKSAKARPAKKQRKQKRPVILTMAQRIAVIKQQEAMMMTLEGLGAWVRAQFRLAHAPWPKTLRSILKEAATFKALPDHKLSAKRAPQARFVENHVVVMAIADAISSTGGLFTAQDILEVAGGVIHEMGAIPPAGWLAELMNEYSMTKAPELEVPQPVKLKQHLNALVKERLYMNLLASIFPAFVLNRKVKGGTFVIVVELDGDAHRRYSQEDEVRRLQEIFKGGKYKKAVVLRLNPDEYQSGDGIRV